jgi:hypothetical protein
MARLGMAENPSLRTDARRYERTGSDSDDLQARLYHEQITNLKKDAGPVAHAFTQSTNSLGLTSASSRIDADVNPDPDS